MKFPSREEIIEINFEMISRYGGDFFGKNNLKNSASLDWVLDAIQYPIFNIDLYPTIVEKAAQLGWVICAGHIFHDGNKRTSSMAVMQFIRANGFEIDASVKELKKIALKIATNKQSKFTIDEYITWIEDHIEIGTGEDLFNMLII